MGIPLIARRRSPACLALTLVVAGLLAACAGGSAAPSGAANSTPPPSSGPGNGSEEAPSSDAAVSDLCGILTPDEVAEALGSAAGPGSVAGPLGSGCEWDAGDAFLMIQKVPMDYFEEAGSRDVRQLDGIGDYAYVGPHAFGRIATARTADAGYLVLGAETIEDDVLIDLLAAFVERAAAVAIEYDGIDIEPAETSPAADWTPGTDECPLTTEDVSEAMDRPMVPGSDSCSWVAESAAATEAYEVYFNPIGPDLFASMDGTRVENVGDEAFAGDFGTLYVRVGERAFSLQVLAFGASPDFPGSTAASEALARRAADALR